MPSRKPITELMPVVEPDVLGDLVEAREADERSESERVRRIYEALEAELVAPPELPR